jgi:hypothetical protein
VLVLQMHTLSVILEVVMCSEMRMRANSASQHPALLPSRSQMISSQSSLPCGAMLQHEEMYYMPRSAHALQDRSIRKVKPASA